MDNTDRTVQDEQLEVLKDIAVSLRVIMGIMLNRTYSPPPGEIPENYRFSPGVNRSTVEGWREKQRQSHQLFARMTGLNWDGSALVVPKYDDIKSDNYHRVTVVPPAS